MKNIAETVKIIAACRDSSELRWEMAIDTDDRDRNYAADYEDCMASYDAAIESLEDAYEGYIVEARGHLEDAKSLEASAGDAQDAIRALEALADLDPANNHKIPEDLKSAAAEIEE